MLVTCFQQLAVLLTFVATGPRTRYVYAHKRIYRDGSQRWATAPRSLWRERWLQPATLAKGPFFSK